VLIVHRAVPVVLRALVLLAAACAAACAAPDPFEHGQVLLDAPDLRVVISSTGSADTVRYSGVKAEAVGDARLSLLELHLFYDRNDSGTLDTGESIGHWTEDRRDTPARLIVLLPGSGEGFRNTGIPAQRLLYQVEVTLADGSTRTATLRASGK